MAAVLLAVAGCTGSFVPSGPIETRSLIAVWGGDTQPIVGAIDIQQGRPGGRVWLSHPNQEDICEGAYTYHALNRGSWGIKCTNGDTASGTMQAGGSGQGSVGTGVDSAGLSIRFRLGADGPARRRVPSRTPSPFDVGPPQGEPIPRAEIEALSRYCVARLSMSGGTAQQKLDYCQCLGREIRATFSLQAFVTRVGEMEAERKAMGGPLNPHADFQPLQRRCAASVLPAAASR